MKKKKRKIVTTQKFQNGGKVVILFVSKRITSMGLKEMEGVVRRAIPNIPVILISEAKYDHAQMFSTGPNVLNVQQLPPDILDKIRSLEK